MSLSTKQYDRSTVMVVCYPEGLAAVVNCCKQSSKPPATVKVSGIKHDGRAAKTAPVAVVDVLGATGEKGVSDTEPPLPEPDRGPPPPPPVCNAALDPGIDEDILSPILRKVHRTV